ncbi:MAG: hypothetical protein M3O15_06860, partial [Acidobacteriota bacterium]|nr:hypothetical protein [Acidobacteriota bacterium]
LSALDPGLLAHGHYVTTDVPLGLAVLLALLAFAHLLARPSLPRLGLAALALAALALVKFSWPLVLPALAAMVLVTLTRPDPASASSAPRPRRLTPRRVLAGGLLLSVAVWLAIWAVYGFRYSPFRGADRATALMIAVDGPAGARPSTMDTAWRTVLLDPATGRPLTGLAATAGFARRHRLLPEAYLYGMAYTWRKAQRRSAYLFGRLAAGGWHWYFPVAFAVKTPLPTLILFACGLTALAMRRAPPVRDPALAAGLVLFALVYGGAAISSHLDIGHRHILPLYPPVFIAASAATVWLQSPRGRLLVGASLAWLTAATLLAYPGYLGYFNELAGGSANGYRVLADSNVDWGQDLKRLAAYCRLHPGPAVKLAQFGDAPLPRGFAPEILLGDHPGLPRAPLTPGTYVVSATELLAVYRPLARDAAWERPEVEAVYRALAARPGLALEDARRYDLWRRARLIRGLRRRPADARIGTSLFLYRLSAAEIAALTAPRSP